MVPRLAAVLTVLVVAQTTLVAALGASTLVIVTSALVGGLAAAGACALVARYLASPLRELRGAVERMAADTHPRRVFPGVKGELSRLVDALNTLSDRMERRIGELEADREQLRTVLAAMIEGVIALGEDERVLFINERARELLEVQGDPVGRPFWEVVRHRPLLDAIRQVRETSSPYREEVAGPGALPRHLTAQVARLPGQAFRGAVLVLHDTTELRRLERVRRELVSNVSHELKTPLAVIQACVETLLDGAMDDLENRTGFLQQIARQSARLHALVLDLLRLGRIESGEQTYQFTRVNLAELVREVVDRHLARAEARHQVLRIEGEAGIASWGDHEAIETILENLLDNAMKYTPEGGQIAVTWSAERDRTRLSVADTGIGIPEADLPRIFERFYRVDRARSRELGGTGLGLSIVKHLVQAMRGEVRTTSEVGRGTTFQVLLPRAP